MKMGRPKLNRTERVTFTMTPETRMLIDRIVEDERSTIGQLLAWLVKTYAKTKGYQ